MNLIKLYANKSSFRTVEFNPTGITLIVGKKESPDTNTNKKKTYNAVGKSLIVRLIHFCLGSNRSEEFTKKLPEWEFSLDFISDGKSYTVTRSTERQNIITLNGEELNLTAFKDRLTDICLSEQCNLPVTFRSILKRFVRDTKASYVEAEAPVPKETPFIKLANNAFLLGLDTSLVKKKYEFKTELDYINSQKKSIEEDPILNSFYLGDKDISIELNYLDKKIEDLEVKLNAFEVAEDYHQIKEDADRSALTISKLENERTVIEMSISSIKESLNIKADVSKEKVEEIFNEANVFFEEKLKATLDEVLNFHKTLLENRVARLKEEKGRLENDLEDVQKRIKTLGEELNGHLKYLNEHRALDEFLSLSNKLSDMKAQSQKYKDYYSLLKEYDLRKQQLKINLTQANIESQEYLDKHISLTQKNQKVFTGFAQEFYENKPSGIAISNNENENQIRFNISPKIQSDTSDGVNEVKIFCYDMTLLTLKHRHNINFLFHDSRLYSDMDPRQRATSFKIAQKATTGNDLQYIATINEDQLLSMKNEIKQEEFDQLYKYIKLELTDRSPETKLLGIEIDFDYDK